MWASTENLILSLTKIYHSFDRELSSIVVFSARPTSLIVSISFFTRPADVQARARALTRLIGTVVRACMHAWVFRVQGIARYYNEI